MHECQCVDKQCRVRGTLGGGQRVKSFENAKDQFAIFVVVQCIAARCRTLESLHPMRRSVRLRRVSSYQHKSEVMAHVFDGAIKWRTEGQEQMVLLLELTVIQGFATNVHLSGEETIFFDD